MEPPSERIVSWIVVVDEEESTLASPRLEIEGSRVSTTSFLLGVARLVTGETRPELDLPTVVVATRDHAHDGNVVVVLAKHDETTDVIFETRDEIGLVRVRGLVGGRAVFAFFSLEKFANGGRRDRRDRRGRHFFFLKIKKKTKRARENEKPSSQFF